MMDHGINELICGYQLIIDATIENTSSDSELTKLTLETFKSMLDTVLPTKFFARYIEDTEHVRINGTDEIRIFDNEKDRNDWVKEVWDEIEGDDDLADADCKAISFENFVQLMDKDMYDPDKYYDGNDEYESVVLP